MEDINNIPETRPQPRIALLTISEYIELNYLISSLEGYDLNKSTQRVFSMNPRAAKTEIQFDKEGNEISYVPKLVALISSEMQINYPLIFSEYELFSSYISTGEEINEFIIGVMSLNAVNWAAMQFKAVKGIGKEVTLFVSKELYNALTDEVREGLVNLGLKLEV